MIRNVLAAFLATAALVAAPSAFADGTATATDVTPSTGPEAGTATATLPPPAPTTPPERTLSINANPFGIVQGVYGANLEWLHGAHGLLVDADYWRSGNDNASVSGAGGHVGYRWHWRGRQNSGFLGVNVGYGYGTAQATVTPSGGQPMKYDLTVNTFEVTADIGKRWQLDNGLNITFRIGGGYASRTASTTVDDPDAKQAAKDVEDALAFLPIALDGELSLGYSF